MKKFLIAALSVFCFLAPVTAYEWGGVFKDDSKVSSADFQSFAIKQSNSIYLWIKTPFGDSGWSMSAEGMYKGTLDIANSTTGFTSIADIDLLKISGTIDAGSGKIALAFGRFVNADNTGVSFGQNCDGVSFKYSVPVVQVSAYAGYTGLLNVLNVSMLGTDGVFLVPATKIYSISLDKAYVPVNLGITFPSLFANQALGFQAEAIVDTSADKYNRYYANALLSGFLSNSVYYSFVTEFGSVNFNNVSNYTCADFVYNASKIANINFGLKFASGKNGFLSPFQGFTSNTAYGSSAAPEMSGVIVPYGAVILKGGPTSTTLSAKLPLSCAEDFAFKGIDLDLNFVAAVMSDLQLGAVVHGYVDIDSEGKESLYSVALNAAIAF